MFDDLSPPYNTIVADPPWPYREKFAQMHSGAGRVEKALPYSGMELDEIKALPVATLAAKDCRLFLWTTNKFLPASLEVLHRWGFEYRQTVVWHKNGNPSPWGGSVAPNHAEFLLVAARGKPERLEMWKGGNVIGVNVGVHSVKPPIFLDLVEQVSPGPYVELFARQPRMGWDAWGHGIEGAA